MLKAVSELNDPPRAGSAEGELLQVVSELKDPRVQAEEQAGAAGGIGRELFRLAVAWS